jgi:hypothetical protein
MNDSGSSQEAWIEGVQIIGVPAGGSYVAGNGNTCLYNGTAQELSGGQFLNITGCQYAIDWESTCGLGSVTGGVGSCAPGPTIHAATDSTGVKHAEIIQFPDPGFIGLQVGASITGTSAATYTNGSAVIGVASNFGLLPGNAVTLTCTGGGCGPPTNFALLTTYYVSTAGWSPTTIELASTVNGTPIVAGALGTGTTQTVSGTASNYALTDVTGFDDITITNIPVTTCAQQPCIGLGLGFDIEASNVHLTGIRGEYLGQLGKIGMTKSSDLVTVDQSVEAFGDSKNAWLNLIQVGPYANYGVNILQIGTISAQPAYYPAVFTNGSSIIAGYNTYDTVNWTPVGFQYSTGLTTPFATTTTYYALGLTSSTYELAATSGGTPIASTCGAACTGTFYTSPSTILTDANYPRASCFVLETNEAAIGVYERGVVQGGGSSTQVTSNLYTGCSQTYPSTIPYTNNNTIWTGNFAVGPTGTATSTSGNYGSPYFEVNSSIWDGAETISPGISWNLAPPGSGATPTLTSTLAPSTGFVANLNFGRVANLSGALTCNGTTTCTWASGNHFLGLIAGDTVTITSVGSFTVSGTPTYTSITFTASPGTFTTPTAYTATMPATRWPTNVQLYSPLKIGTGSANSSLVLPSGSYGIAVDESTTAGVTTSGAGVCYIRSDATTNTWRWSCNGGAEGSIGSGVTITLETNGANNTSQTALNFLTSTTNSDGLTITPSNPATSSEEFEITGTYSGGISSSQVTTGLGFTPAASNAATTVNGQTCTLGSTCTVPIQTNGSSNTSQAGINLSTSTTNSVGLTVTPTNSATNVEKFEITGSSYTGNAATATTASGLNSTGAAVAAAFWPQSVSAGPYVSVFDDFVVSADMTGQSVGSPTGNTIGGSSSVSDANHIGTVKLYSGTVNATGEAGTVGGVTPSGLNSSTPWKWESAVYVTPVPGAAGGAAAVSYQAGLAATVAASPWATSDIGFYSSTLNGTAADWYCQYNSVAAVDSGQAATVGWQRLSIVSDGTHVTWYINGAAVCSPVLTSSMPSVLMYAAWTSVSNYSTTGVATMYVDYLLWQRAATR